MREQRQRRSRDPGLSPPWDQEGPGGTRETMLEPRASIRTKSQGQNTLSLERTAQPEVWAELKEEVGPPWGPRLAVWFWVSEPIAVCPVSGFGGPAPRGPFCSFQDEGMWVWVGHVGSKTWNILPVTAGAKEQGLEMQQAGCGMTVAAGESCDSTG